MVCRFPAFLVLILALAANLCAKDSQNPSLSIQNSSTGGTVQGGDPNKATSNGDAGVLSIDYSSKLFTPVESKFSDTKNASTTGGWSSVPESPRCGAGTDKYFCNAYLKKVIDGATSAAVYSSYDDFANRRPDLVHLVSDAFHSPNSIGVDLMVGQSVSFGFKTDDTDASGTIGSLKYYSCTIEISTFRFGSPGVCYDLLWISKQPGGTPLCADGLWMPQGYGTGTSLLAYTQTPPSAYPYTASGTWVPRRDYCLLDPGKTYYCNVTATHADVDITNFNPDAVKWYKDHPDWFGVPGTIDNCSMLMRIPREPPSPQEVSAASVDRPSASCYLPDGSIGHYHSALGNGPDNKCTAW